MKRSSVLVLIAAALAACTAGPRAQNGVQPTLITPIMLEPPPIYALFGFRERLQLTPEQITRLDSIAIAVKERNDLLIDTLQARAATARNQAGLVVADSASRMALHQIRESNRQAARSVGEVLNATQQQTACQIFGEQDEERESRRREMRRRMGSGTMTRRTREAQADSLNAMLPGRVWPWCGTAGSRPTG